MGHRGDRSDGELGKDRGSGEDLEPAEYLRMSGRLGAMGALWNVILNIYNFQILPFSFSVIVSQ